MAFETPLEEWEYIKTLANRPMKRTARVMDQIVAFAVKLSTMLRDAQADNDLLRGQIEELEKRFASANDKDE